MRALAFAACLAAAPAQAATLTVTITGVRTTLGHVRVAICGRPDFLKPVCRYSGNAPAALGAVTITIQGIPAGTYAAEAFHDENDNTIIDRNFFGFPTEAIGFSNDARMHFGPPRFDDAAFSLPAAGLRITFAVHKV